MNMMYTEPEMKIIRFASEDILVTSGGDDPNGPIELPPIPVT